MHKSLPTCYRKQGLSHDCFPSKQKRNQKIQPSSRGACFASKSKHCVKLMLRHGLHKVFNDWLIWNISTLWMSLQNQVERR